MITRKIGLISFVLFLFAITFVTISCSEKSREDRIAEYLKKLGVKENAFVAVLNPNYCGSCTDYSITWLVNKAVTHEKQKLILTTGKLNPGYKTKLAHAGYHFIAADQDKLSRMGITLTSCTSIELIDGDVEEINTVK